MLERLGLIVFRRRVVVLVVWVLLVAAGAVFGGAVFGKAEAPGLRAGAESTEVQERIDRDGPYGEELVAVLSGADARDTQVGVLADQAIRMAWAIPGVSEIRDPWTTETTDLFADGGQGAVVQIQLLPWLTQDQALVAVEEIRTALEAGPFPSVLIGGPLPAQEAFVGQATQDAAIGEGIALVVLFVLLLVVLGGWFLGSIPVVAALAGIAVSLLALSGIALVASVSEFAVNVVTVLGIGLAVDYGLLVLSRFREERARAAVGRKGAPDPAAVLGATLARAGHTVLVSGLTVVCALAALFLLGDPLLNGIAVGGIVAVLVAIGTGLTFVPALIAVGHRRIPAPGERFLGRTWFAARRAAAPNPLLARLARFAQARPWVTLAGSVTLLLVLAAPLLSLQVGNSDARALPRHAEARLAYEEIERIHPTAAQAPLTVLVEVRPDHEETLADLKWQLRSLDGVTDVFLTHMLEENSTVFGVQYEGHQTGETAQRLVTEIRAMEADFGILVGGPTAELVDAADALGAGVGWAILAVVLVTGMLLLRLTGSVVVSAKTIVLNLLSLAATLGVVVAVFQWGWGSSLLGFDPWGALDLTSPLLLFMFCFGLSMDYHMFLIARIKEAWDGRDADEDAKAANDRAVLSGIVSSGPVVTLAAVAIVIVFLGFAAGQLVAVKEVGVGMTVAILLDVTVVRGLVLPAAMTLLGERNWWRPALRSRRPQPAQG